MRVWSRIALVVVFLFSTVVVTAEHYQADCPLSLADSTPPGTSFHLSPHGVFRLGSLVYALRGQVLTTYSLTDVGNLQIVREDFIGSMAARETNGGVAFSNGYLYVSSEAGLEIYDLRNVRVGGSAPILVHRAAGYHYRKMAVNGNRLAGLYPSTDLPCYPDGTSFCANEIEIVDISVLTAPVRVGTIRSTVFSAYRGLNDIAFNFGYLIAVSEEALIAFDISNPAMAATAGRIAVAQPGGRWLVSNGGSLIGVGNETTIDLFSVRPGISPFFQRTALLTVPFYLGLDRENALRFHPAAFWDDATNRLITMIDEVDPMTRKSARTIAFDVFDLAVPRYEGSVERIYEEVTLVNDDEVKYNPLAAGQQVYVIGETTGIQSWGACGVATGRIELESPFHLTCGGAQIYGWVTGTQKIVSVELFMDNTLLGAGSLGGPLRKEVSATTPVTTWRVNVNLDQTARGEYQLRAIATDALGKRRQFAMERIFFQGPGQNCSNPRRRAVR